MGRSDVASKNWLQDKVRYADLFNGILFDGEQIIRPEELELISGEADVVLADKNGKAKKIQRYRDIVMKWKQDINLAVYACENQQNIHYAMPVRIMLYDSLSYTEQMEQIWKAHQTVKDKQPMETEELLSRFRKDDRLLPVITIVFYYGSREWDAATSLYDMLDLPDPWIGHKVLTKYIPNYPINLIDAGNIAHMKRFHSDLQLLFEMLKYRKDKNALIRFVKEHRDYFENIDTNTFWAFGEFLQVGKLWNKILPESKEKEGKIDMCKALQDWYDEGVEQGMEQGIAQGEERGRINTFYELLSSGAISMDLVAEKLKQTKQEVLEGMAKAGFAMPK